MKNILEFMLADSIKKKHPKARHTLLAGSIKNQEPSLRLFKIKLKSSNCEVDAIQQRVYSETKKVK